MLERTYLEQSYGWKQRSEQRPDAPLLEEYPLAHLVRWPDARIQEDRLHPD